MTGRGLAIVVCGAGPAGSVASLVRLAQAGGWTVDVIATRAALSFVDPHELEQVVGSPVRSEYRTNRTASRTLAAVGAVIVAPATYNTMNKLALGIADNYAVGSVAEAIGRGTPVIVVPFVNSALATRRPYQWAIQMLREEAVVIVAGEEYGWEPHEPGTGDQRAAAFPWARALAEADTAVQRLSRQ